MGGAPPRGTRPVGVDGVGWEVGTQKRKVAQKKVKPSKTSNLQAWYPRGGTKMVGEKPSAVGGIRWDANDSRLGASLSMAITAPSAMKRTGQ